MKQENHDANEPAAIKFRSASCRQCGKAFDQPRGGRGRRLAYCCDDCRNVARSAQQRQFREAQNTMQRSSQERPRARQLRCKTCGALFSAPKKRRGRDLGFYSEPCRSIAVSRRAMRTKARAELEALDDLGQLALPIREAAP